MSGCTCGRRSQVVVLFHRWFNFNFLNFNAVLIAALCVFVAASSPRSIAADPIVVWIGDQKYLKGIDTAANQFSHVITLDHEATSAAVDPQDHSIWTLQNKELVRFDQTGARINRIDLNVIASNLSAPKMAAFNPYDGSLWITSETTLLHVDKQGNKLFQWLATENIQSLALDIDESVWVLTTKSLVHLSMAGSIRATLDLAAHLSAPTLLALDSLGGLAWIADKSQLLQFNINDLHQAPRVIALPALASGAAQDIAVIGTHPVFGTLWLVSRDTFYIFDRQGGLVRAVDLIPYSLGKIEVLSYDPLGLALWLGSKTAAARFSSGGEFLARLPVDKYVAVIGVVPFTLSPTLSLVSPPDNSLTNNPKPTVRLGLGAKCSGTPCLLPDTYVRSLILDFDLNGQAVGPLFVIEGNEALFTPAARLPEGLNTLKAKAQDLFGHTSEEINSRFTVDTIAPSFIALSPADGSTVTTGAVTISGQVDDPAANVLLSNASGSGISMGGANFSFAVLLKAGLNTFSLTANDPAGNVVQASVRLTYSAGSIQITNLVVGQTIAGDRTDVMGTFEGPVNIGITVNGVAAQIFGNQFFVSDVELQPGENVLTIVVSTIDGELSRQFLTVYSNGASPLRIERVVDSVTTTATVAGTGVNGFGGDGALATQAQISYVRALAVGPANSLYLVDGSRIRRIDTSGRITTVAGTGTYGFSGDGGPASQAMLSPRGIAVGADGSLYIADTDNMRIRKVGPDGIIRTIAGSGNYGDSGDGGPATQARFRYPIGITVAPDGSVYVADSDSNRIRRVSPAGVIQTVAGTGVLGFSGDGGPATQARINYPWALALDSRGNLYFSEIDRPRIRRVAPDGVITTVAGNGISGFSGDNAAAVSARIGSVYGLAVHTDGSLYFSDADSNRIRRVAPDGVITTFAGTGAYGFGGDGEPPTQARLAGPTGLALDASGNPYIADTENFRVRGMAAQPSSLSNLAPVTVAFRVINQTGTPLTRVEADLNDDGATDITTTNVDAPLRYRYEQAGAFVAKFRITDIHGKVYALQFPVVLQDPQQRDQLFTTLWSGMNDALKVGDLTRATRFLNESAKRKYQPVFGALKPHLAEIVVSYSPMRRVSISEDIGEYTVVRSVNGQNRIYLIYFLRDADGVWRLDAM